MRHQPISLIKNRETCRSRFNERLRVAFGAESSAPETDVFTRIRQLVREELRASQDRQSFAAASDIMTQEEACLYLKISRTALYRLRRARKLAKSREAKDATFAPDHGSGKKLNFRRSEIDAWLARQS